MHLNTDTSIKNNVDEIKELACTIKCLIKHADQFLIEKNKRYALKFADVAEILSDRLVNLSLINKDIIALILEKVESEF